MTRWFKAIHTRRVSTCFYIVLGDCMLLLQERFSINSRHLTENDPKEKSQETKSQRIIERKKMNSSR